MKVLGSFTFGTLEQRRLANGVSLDLPRDRVLPNILKRARIGNLLWAKEPWRWVQSKRRGPQHISFALVGPIGTPGPERYRKVMHDLDWKPQPAKSLARVDSRATLEIMGIGADALRVLVHMQQVDAFVKARGA